MVIRRNLFTHHVIEESWLRTNIFCSTCTNRGKVCRLIIYAGSCTNIVSEEVVAKLALFTEPHPTPYRLAWLNAKTDLSISKRCRVPFSIGTNYKDLVCCDVIPMDACHILLGRPRQYDRRTIHDGFVNTYNFSYEGNHITLLPSQEAAPSSQSDTSSIPVSTPTKTSQPVLLIKAKKIFEECETTQGGMALILKPMSLVLNCEVPAEF